jgi:hypothetical protein
MHWSFFASSHKNGKVDSVCALFKWEFCKEIKPHIARLQNAHHVVIFCQQRTCIYSSSILFTFKLMMSYILCPYAPLFQTLFVDV